MGADLSNIRLWRTSKSSIVVEARLGGEVLSLFRQYVDVSAQQCRYVPACAVEKCSERSHELRAVISWLQTHHRYQSINS